MMHSFMEPSQLSPPTFAPQTFKYHTLNLTDRIPGYSPREEEIRDRERSIQFKQFLRKRVGQVSLKDTLITSTFLKQPEPMILADNNLLETFGCVPGPGIRENAKLMMQNTIS